MTIPSEKELFKAGAHFGHKTTTWHPKMSDFIYAEKNGVHIIDLQKTRKKIEEAVEFIKKIIADESASPADKKQILFIGTKIQAKKIVEKNAQEIEMPYVTERWLGGTLTNFKVINGLVKKLDKLEKQASEENYTKKYTKKERHEFDVDMKRLKKLIGGIRNMKKLPVAIFIASARYEKTAIAEARKKNIPTIAICDTNSNPQKIDYPIPANDDALKSLELIITTITNSIKSKNKNK